MKKFILLAISIILFVGPKNINAASPGSYGKIFHQCLPNTTCLENQSITATYFLLKGNVLGYLSPDNFIQIEFDETIFDIVTFESSHGFTYDKNTKKITHPDWKSNGYAVSNGEKLWTFYLTKKNTNAKGGIFDGQYVSFDKTIPLVTYPANYNFSQNTECPVCQECSKQEVVPFENTECPTIEEKTNNNVYYYIIGTLSAIIIVELIIILRKKLTK